jgi:hypothetical protein
VIAALLLILLGLVVLFVVVGLLVWRRVKP